MKERKLRIKNELFQALEYKEKQEICLVIDFHHIDDHLIQIYPLVTMNEIPQKIFGFNHASNLDLNMGY